MAYAPTGQRPSGGPQRFEGNQVPNPQKISYFTESGDLDGKLVDQEAQSWAEKIRGLKTTQLRRFFDEVKAIERQLDLAVGQGAARDEAFAWERARFSMLKAKVLYAKGRLKREMPDEFVQFIVNHTHSVGGHNDFKAFAKHFEAVVGFHKFFAKD